MKKARHSDATLDAFPVKNGEILIGGVPLTRLANRVGQTPFYAYDRQKITERAAHLRKHLPDTPTLPVFSTGAAAQMASNNPNIGAIASSLAIKTYNLQVVVKGIEDYQGNTTRFLVIGKHSPDKSGADKTSLLLGLLVNRPGALNDVLNVLSERNIDLTKIESRPIKGKQWKYLFFLDIAGHIDDPIIQEGCEILKKTSSYYEWLGSYPKADNPELDLS